MSESPVTLLPPGIRVFERGWLSANNILCSGPEGHTLIDSGYGSHATQTLALLEHALQGQPLDRLINTHLHSDHCGGNAALQAHYPQMQTWIPPGQADAVTRWDHSGLSYAPTGQSCPRFAINGVLQPGDELTLAGLPWQVHAAPGHDPHAVLLFQPGHRILVSGDALWENGFGVVFPELEGEPAFAEVGDTLDLIEQLAPIVVIPGHGRPFGGDAASVAAALERARSRLRHFTDDPGKHLRYALKVLLKFKLLEWQRASVEQVHTWARATPYLLQQHERHAQADFDTWLQALIDDLCRSGAARREDGWLIDA